MDNTTAKVQRDSHRWNGYPTLLFRGVAKVRAVFGFPSEAIRRAITPQVHTDSVGLVRPPQPHTFIVETLKRDYPTGDDNQIRDILGAADALLTIENPELLFPQLGFALGQAIANKILNEDEPLTLFGLAVAINQKHFLAGRRSFRIATVAEFAGLGAPPPPGSGILPTDWVFETAAAERYSCLPYLCGTEVFIGAAFAVVEPIWRKMGLKIAGAYGTMLGQVVKHAQFPADSNWEGTHFYNDIARRHQPLS